MKTVATFRRKDDKILKALSEPTEDKTRSEK